MTPELHHPHRLSSCLLPAILTLFVSATSLFAAQPGTSPVKIFILAGQSNMQGQGNMSPATTPGTLEYTVAHDRAGDYQFVSNGAGGWASFDDVWIHYERSASTLLTGDLTTGYGASPTTIGPELGFGSFVGDYYDNQVLLVKAAWGGKSLAVDFRPPSSGGTTGFYYGEILRLVQDATTHLATYFPGYDGQGYEIAGFGWHQGWNDRVNQTYNDEYEVNMANFIRDIRRDLGIANLPFVIATTGMTGWTDTHPRALSLMNAQLAVAQYREFRGNVFTVDTRDFYRPVSESPANQGYHWNRNAATYLDIGLAMGEAMTILAPDNHPPDVAADNATVMVGEGSVATNTGTFSGTAGDTVTISADIGTVMQTGTDSGTWSWSHTPADGPATPTVTITATDSSKAKTTTTFGLTVANVGPVVALDPLTSINENGTVTLTGTITDPGTLDTFTLDIAWGDPLSPDNHGQFMFAPSPSGSQSFSITHRYLDDNPGGTARDHYTIQATVTDNDSLSGNDSGTFMISNVRPDLALDPVMSIDENGVATLTGTITDPGTLDTFSLFVDWGDPLNPDNFENFNFPASASGSQTFTLTHRYLDDNPSGTPQDSKVIFALLLDDEGASDTALGSVRINNLAPEITALGLTPNAGGVTLGVEFTDPGLADSHTAQIMWGDGSSSPLTLPPGDRSFQATHSYSMEPPSGGFQVTVTISDDDTGSDTEATGPPPSPPGRSEIDELVRLPGGDIQLGFSVLPGEEFRIEYSHNLVNWFPVTPTVVATGNRVQWTDEGPPATMSAPSSVPRRYYRCVRISPPLTPTGRSVPEP